MYRYNILNSMLFKLSAFIMLIDTTTTQHAVAPDYHEFLMLEVSNYNNYSNII